MPDAAFWLSLLFAILSFALASLMRVVLLGDGESVGLLVAGNAIAALIMAPLAAWMVALATERPLAIDPRPWLRSFASWLPALLLGQLLITTPLSALHAHIDLGLVRGTIDRSIGLELVDGAISVAIVLIGLGLAVTAYRRVAKA